MAEEGIWRTVRGRRVYIVDGTIYFGGKEEYERRKQRKNNLNLGKNKEGIIVKVESSKNILTNASENGIINSSSGEGFLVGKTLGAKGQNYSVYDPDTGNYYSFVEGTYVHHQEIFAGKGASTPLRAEVAEGLTEQFGGSPELWQHVKGIGTLKFHGEALSAEVHWFQEESVGKVKFKLKEWLE